MVYDAASDDANVLNMIHDESCLDDSPGCEIDGAVRWDLDFRAGQVLGAVHAGAEVDEGWVADEDVLRRYALPGDGVGGIGRRFICHYRQRCIAKDMNIVESVSIEFHAEGLRSLKCKTDGAVIDDAG